MFAPSLIVMSAKSKLSLNVYKPKPSSVALIVPIVSNVYAISSTVVLNCVPRGNVKTEGRPARLPVLTDRLTVMQCRSYILFYRSIHMRMSKFK